MLKKKTALFLFCFLVLSCAKNGATTVTGDTVLKAQELCVAKGDEYKLKQCEKKGTEFTCQCEKE